MIEAECTTSYAKGMKLLEGRVHLDGRRLPKPGLIDRFFLARARKFLMKAAEGKSESGAPLLFLGKIEERLGNNERCISWLRMANEASPENGVVMLELGAAYGRQGQHRELVELLVPLVRMHPEDTRIHSNLGVALLLLGESGRAIGAFENAVALEPTVGSNRRLLEYAVAVHEKRKSQPRSANDIARNI